VSWQFALLPVLMAVELPPADHGTTQFAWQVAACALQVIMQLVTVDVCASRILAA
jgi:di/tricarboxylate transporter